MSYATYEDFIAQEPFCFRGQPYDVFHPLQLRQILCEPPPLTTCWVSRYQGHESRIPNDDVYQCPGFFELQVCEESQVIFEGLYILNSGPMSSIWYLCYDVFRQGRRPQRKEIFFTGPAWPILRFHVVAPRTHEPRGIVYTVPARILTFGTVSDRAFQSFMVTFLTRVPGRVRLQIPVFEASLRVVENL